MQKFDDVDTSLFGVTAAPPLYDGLAQRWDDIQRNDTACLVLDLKSEAGPEPLDEMQAMLSEMTKELRERFQRFQGQRRTAEQIASEAEDETDRKLAQADAKAAIEAVSLIVRTLEKIDSQHRTILSERRDAAATQGEAANVEALVAEFDRRVEEKAQAQFNRWKAEHERTQAPTSTDLGMGTGGDGKNGP